MYIVHISSGMCVELVLYMETWTWLYSTYLASFTTLYFLQSNRNPRVYCLSKVDSRLWRLRSDLRDIHGYLDANQIFSDLNIYTCSYDLDVE